MSEDAGFSGGDLRLGLLERDAIVAIVDVRDHLFADDVLIVGDRHLGDVARHFRRDRELTRGDEGVVGRLEMPRIVPVEIAGCRDDHEHGQADGEHIGIPTQEICTGFVVLFVFCRLLVLRLGRRRIPVFGLFVQRPEFCFSRLPYGLGR